MHWWQFLDIQSVIIMTKKKEKSYNLHACLYYQIPAHRKSALEKKLR